MKKLLMFLCFVVGALMMNGQTKQTDNERLVRIETLLERIDKRIDGIDKRIDGIDKRIDRIEDRMDRIEDRIDRIEDRMDANLKWLAGIMFSSLFVIIGFVLWDRRSTVSPVRKKQEQHHLALKKLSKKFPEITEFTTT